MAKLATRITDAAADLFVKSRERAAFFPSCPPFEARPQRLSASSRPGGKLPRHPRRMRKPAAKPVAYSRHGRTAPATPPAAFLRSPGRASCSNPAAFIEENCDLAPKTAALLRGLPGVYTAFFSVLEPHQHIKPHWGYWKGFVRYHLGVVIPDDNAGGKCWIRINPNAWDRDRREEIEQGAKYRLAQWRGRAVRRHLPARCRQ